MCMDEFVLPGTGRGHGEFDSPDTNPDQGADFQQLQPDGGAGGMRELGVGKADAAQRAEQHVGHRGEPQAQLVGAHGIGGGAVGEQIELAFLDAVFHLATSAVDRLVEIFSAPVFFPQRGDDEARVGFIAGPLRLADHAPLTAPTIQRTPAEVPKDAGWFAARIAQLTDLFDLVRDL